MTSGVFVLNASEGVAEAVEESLVEFSLHHGKASCGLHRLLVYEDELLPIRPHVCFLCVEQEPLLASDVQASAKRFDHLCELLLLCRRRGSREESCELTNEEQQHKDGDENDHQYDVQAPASSVQINLAAAAHGAVRLLRVTLAVSHIPTSAFDRRARLCGAKGVDGAELGALSSSDTKRTSRAWRTEGEGRISKHAWRADSWDPMLPGVHVSLHPLASDIEHSVIDLVASRLRQRTCPHHRVHILSVEVETRTEKCNMAVGRRHVPPAVIPRLDIG
mmetsp:Transcript_23634/g.76932  ORF Transcript_23634/g.76932 Transcript_23634/m.76932 type:complete len:277 (-) Transcript_23634:48-878(-)